MLSILWKSDLFDKKKKKIQDFFQDVAVSILQYGFTKWNLTKRVEKKLDMNCTRMLRVV